MTITSLATSTVSWIFTHPSIDWAHGCLTSVIGLRMVAPCQRGSSLHYSSKLFFTLLRGNNTNIGLTIPGNWSFIADFMKTGEFHMKSGGFYVKS